MDFEVWLCQDNKKTRYIEGDFLIMSKFRQHNHVEALEFIAECANFEVWDLIRENISNTR